MPGCLKIRFTNTQGNSIFHLTDNIKKIYEYPKALSVRSCLIKDFSWCHLYPFISIFLAKDCSVVFVLLENKMCCSTQYRIQGRKLIRYKVGYFFQSLSFQADQQIISTGNQIYSMHFRIFVDSLCNAVKAMASVVSHVPRSAH